MRLMRQQKKHDLAYDMLYPKQAGMPGVMNDATTPANIDAMKSASKVIQKFATGEKDDITGKKISVSEFKGAQVMYDGFYAAEKVKPIYNMSSNIFDFIRSNVNEVIKITEDIKYKTTQGINALNN